MKSNRQPSVWTARENQAQNVERRNRQLETLVKILLALLYGVIEKFEGLKTTLFEEEEIGTLSVYGHQ